MRLEFQTAVSRVSVQTPLYMSSVNSSAHVSSSTVPLPSAGNVSQNVITHPISSSPQDLQCQMLSLLTEMFSKLTTGASESKSEWPKFMAILKSSEPGIL